MYGDNAESNAAEQTDNDEDDDYDADVYDNDNNDALDDDGDNDNDADDEEEIFTDRTNEDNIQNETSTRQYRRVKNELLMLLPSHVLDNTHIFKKCYIAVGSDDQFRSQLQTMDLPRGNLSENQVKYKVQKMLNVLERRSSYQKNLFSLRLEHIITHPKIEAVMNATGVVIPTDIVPPPFQLARIAKEEVSRLLSCSITHAEYKRRTAIELVVNVAKAGKLPSNEHGDITLLSDAV